MNQPTAVQTTIEPMARSRGNVINELPFFCGVLCFLLERRSRLAGSRCGVSNARSSNARAVFRYGSVSSGSFVRLRFLIEKFRARPLVLAQLLVQRDNARGRVALVARRGFDVAFK